MAFSKLENVNIYHISLNHPKLHVLGRGSEGEVCSSVPPTTALHGQGALVSTQASGLLPSSLSSQMRTRPQDWDLELSLLSAREGRQDEWEKTLLLPLRTCLTNIVLSPVGEWYFLHPSF